MILTLTGASGAGKTTIDRGLLTELPFYSRMIPSYTTREPRDNDISGEYKYVSKFRFWFLKTIGFFRWTAYPHGGGYYGTTKLWVRKALRDDSTVYIMNITPDTVVILRNFAQEKGFLSQVHSFYIFSPPQEILRERLKSRGDKEDEIEKRLTDCLKWDWDALNSGISYEFIRNDVEVQKAVTEIKKRFLEKISASDCLF